MTFTFERRLHTFKQFNWPHKYSKNDPGKPVKYKSQPEDFAQAGFYCRPLVGSTDTVACFMCLKNLDGWEPNDSAWNEHKSHSPTCPLVTLNLSSSRSKTFEKWPGAAVKGGTAALAEAGFFHFPKVDNDDTCICFQCGLALDGWEEGDDPFIEHGRRRPKCPHVALKQFIKPASFDFILNGQSDESAVKEIIKNPGDETAAVQATPLRAKKITTDDKILTTTAKKVAKSLGERESMKKITISVPKEDIENFPTTNTANLAPIPPPPPPSSTKKRPKLQTQEQTSQSSKPTTHTDSSYLSEILKIFPELQQNQKEASTQSFMEMSVQEFFGQVISEKVKTFEILLKQETTK